MSSHQYTIQQQVSVTGLGLHTGMPVTITFKPADIDSGFVFKRTDLPSEPIIPASAAWATDTERGTTLCYKNAKVSTIEHVLAACIGMGLHNLLIELNAQEAPIMDGSSRQFTDALLQAGLLKQKALVEYLSVNKSITYKDDEKNVEMIALPYDGFKVTSMIDFNSPVLGQQYATMATIQDFNKEISDARTFVFFRELKYLAMHNLIKGGDLSNALVVVDKEVTNAELNELAILLNKPLMAVAKEGVLNNSPMRFTNEPARHKLLDVIGDLALVGRPLKAHIIASRPGHKTNVEFARILQKQLMN